MSINRWQAHDIAKYIKTLDPLIDEEEEYGVRDFSWGDGFRAVIKWPSLPVYSDAESADELLGTIRADENGFRFYAAAEDDK